MNHQNGLADRTVIVTGAIGGIGSAVANQLALYGCRLVLVDVDHERLLDLVDRLPGSGHVMIQADLRQLDSHADIVRLATANSSAFLGLAHLAAVLVRRKDIADITEDDWDRQIDTNLKAGFFLNRAVAQALVAQGDGGAIVNFTSQGWWTGGFGGSIPYAASKGGIVSMSRGLARALAPHRIRVNTLAPGFVDTAMMRSEMTEEQLAASVAQVPIGRMAHPSELAGSVAFLLSTDASYITGATLNVTGGQLMY